MADYTVIADVSRYLLELLREALCPALVPSREQIALGSPDAGANDSMLLLYLYSIKDYCDFVPERTVFAHSGAVSRVPMAVELRYTVFFNKRAQTPLDALAELRIFGRIMQAIFCSPVVDVKHIHSSAGSMDEPASLLFSKLDDSQKQELWNGFSEPLRTAVYFEVGPLLIDAGATIIPRVREIEGDVKRK